MEEQKKIKLEFGKPQKITHPILGNAVQNESGAWVIQNPALVGKVYSILCPQCQKVILVKAPAAKRYKVSCKDCGTSVSFIGVESKKSQGDTTTQESPKEQSTQDKESNPTHKYKPAAAVKPAAKIVWGGLFSKKSFDIVRLGQYYIGRDDDETKSDVSIKDDYVSRRSLLLEAIPKGGNECLYKLTVKSAANPVLVNGQQKEIGESVYLNYGDTILVGNTTLTFKKRTS